MLVTDAEIRKLLKEIKTIAIVGAKDKPGQPVDMVGRYLIKAGYSVIPVHPVRKGVWSLNTYAGLDDVPQGRDGVTIDAVVLFRASEHCFAHAHEALRLNPLPKVFWMQEGISCHESSELMEKSGVLALDNVCIKKEHERLVAGMQLGRL